MTISFIPFKNVYCNITTNTVIIILKQKQLSKLLITVKYSTFNFYAVM